MRWLYAALLLSQASSPQDLPEKIRQLVERMDNDDIAIADQAAADMAKLGPTALGPLREEARKRTGDLKLRLEEIVCKIERTQRLQKATGNIPLVTLSAKDRPVKEILDDLARQTGLTIEGEKLPAEARASLHVQNEVLWKAIDLLCRGNGTLMYAYAPKKIVIQPGPYRDLPRAIERGFFFFVDRMNWEVAVGQPDSTFEIEAALVLPPGADPLSVDLQLDELEDDQGTRMIADAGGGAGVFLSTPGVEEEESTGLVRTLNTSAEHGPKENAKSLAKFKGKVALKFAAESALRVAIKDPLQQPIGAERAGKFGLRIKRWKKDGDKIRINLSATAFRRPGDTDAPPWRIILRDRAGNGAVGRQSNTAAQGGATFVLEDAGGKETDVTLFDGEMVFTLPAGGEPASLELLEATHVDELVIPFDFKALPLR